MMLTSPEHMNKEKGITLLKESARNNNSAAAYLVGLIYQSEQFGFFDLHESDKWLAKAYDMGSKSAEKVVEYIEFANTNNRFTAENFPKLYSLLGTQTQNISSENTSSEKTSSENPSTENPSSEKKEVSSLNAQIALLKESLIKQSQTDIEVITVSSPSITEVFDQSLVAMHNTYPDKYQVGTGSKIIGQTCEKNISCSSFDPNDIEIQLLLQSLDFGIIR